MQLRRLFPHALASIALIAIVVSLAQAQSNRTWVSSTGDDNNTCSRQSPCKTFAGALAKTNTNGEINCVNPDGYGAVTITKSLTIDCEDTQGAILASFVTGIHINLGAAVPGDPQRMVRLRGLVVNGTGGIRGQGIRGIDINSGNTAPVTVHIEQVVVDNFSADGIRFTAAGGELLVRNTVAQNCQGAGLFVTSLDSKSVVHTTVEGSTFAHNKFGMQAETAVRITASNSNFSNNSLDGVNLGVIDASQSEANLYSCFISGNPHIGVAVDGGKGMAIVRLDGNHIVNNIAIGGGGAKGVQITGNAQAFSRGNNTINGNDINVDPSGGLLPLPGQ